MRDHEIGTAPRPKAAPHARRVPFDISTRRLPTLAPSETVRVGGATSAAVRWLVSDQLGTPRMTLDQTGSLAGVQRHDYLPFGEDIGAGAGGRTTAVMKES